MAENVGEQLKKARLDRGLTLLEASHQTRIRPHYLEALENDRRDLLPSIVQGRGFLRLYADFLRLPSAALIDAWNYGSGAAPLSASPANTPDTETTEDNTSDGDENQVPGKFIEEAPQTTANMSSEMILVEIGRKLRMQRESLNLKISDIERFTHLR
jgi:cytoskeleton protein RodZ